MDRSEILDKIEEIQDDVDAKGFMGSNENDLWRREAIADYIIKNFVICSSSLQLKENETLTFDEWYKTFGYSKTIAQTYIKRGIRYSEDAMRSMYKTEYLHQL